MKSRTMRELNVVSSLKTMKDMTKEPTLDDVINEATEKAGKRKNCRRCQRKNGLLVTWLTELKQYKEKYGEL